MCCREQNFAEIRSLELEEITRRQVVEILPKLFLTLTRSYLKLSLNLHEI